MKILWLSNSDEVYGDLPPERRTSTIAGRLVQAEIGEPVELVVRVIWPSPELPEIIDGWLERYEPDVVIFHLNGFWYLYGSVPLKFQRKFGSLGRLITRAGLKAGSTGWFVRTPIYHASRRMLLRTVGAAYYFTPREVCDASEACVRRILRHEGTGVVLRLPLSPSSWVSQPPGAMSEVHHRMAALAASLHISFVSQDPDIPEEGERNFWTTGDRLHTNEEGHDWYARIDAVAIVAEWRKLHAATG